MVLIQNDLLHVVEEPLVEAPRPYATAQDRDEYRKARDISIEVQTLMVGSMEPHLKAYYHNHNPFVIINAFQALFAPQVRKLSFECMNEFLTTKMEENTCLRSHLNNMHRLYRHLIDKLNYLMTNELGIDEVLQSLLGSYNECV
jgi:hypothetical protein